jgi:hypothetical protein
VAAKNGEKSWVIFNRRASFSLDFNSPSGIIASREQYAVRNFPNGEKVGKAAATAPGSPPLDRRSRPKLMREQQQQKPSRACDSPAHRDPDGTLGCRS